ncbi:protein tyrosine phosphatase [Thecamonas trahens ATCC 50062]|uniref:Protein tyrosine phosphatase n=1 Tax=Thecamonas trahens ATCC 50062 TaxID=461836 RepID=A0A0L0DNI9_THETB|nr:protein tyrosine phosphatase [Thecamonas trahens ATCC 50062]KNC52988.1 protein tyrosine phosphatase [Thecamonas trahens ATCC 50062]|eukprot:XP_013754875.1 protein tyrosine phosphatase [Thecamonas trahens ATCC 50062]
MAGVSTTCPKVLFVCLGNICRSPLAQGVMEAVAREAEVELVVDSAGTGAYHVGEAPDPRGQATAKRHGLDTSGQRARQATKADFDDFDLVVAMDRDNYAHLRRLASADMVKAKLRTFMSYVPEDGRKDVPDCWYADDPEESFEDVYSVFVLGCPRILDELLASRASS